MPSRRQQDRSPHPQMHFGSRSVATRGWSAKACSDRGSPEALAPPRAARDKRIARSPRPSDTRWTRKRSGGFPVSTATQGVAASPRPMLHALASTGWAITSYPGQLSGTVRAGIPASVSSAATSISQASPICFDVYALFIGRLWSGTDTLVRRCQTLQPVRHDGKQGLAASITCGRSSH
jgi:hypothetical protein